jgi:hypothetical protein
MVCGRVGVVDLMLSSEERNSSGFIQHHAFRSTTCQSHQLHIRAPKSIHREPGSRRKHFASVQRKPHPDISPWIRLWSRKICALSQLRLWLLWWWECGYDWSRMLQHKRMVVSIGHLYVQAKTSCNISPHLDGFSNK